MDYFEADVARSREMCTSSVSNVIYHIDTEFWTVYEAVCMFDQAEP